jgi:predicted Co/Zn/Cd cation transporter (cation efflux family)
VRDHRRILGTLFIAWAVLQAAATLVVGLGPESASLAYPAVFWVTSLLMVAIYAWVGFRLRQRDPRARVIGLALSALTLLSFPIGTVLGIYGLYALLRHPSQVPA